MWGLVDHIKDLGFDIESTKAREQHDQSWA